MVENKITNEVQKEIYDLMKRYFHLWQDTENVFERVFDKMLDEYGKTEPDFHSTGVFDLYRVYHSNLCSSLKHMEEYKLFFENEVIVTKDESEVVSLCADCVHRRKECHHELYKESPREFKALASPQKVMQRLAKKIEKGKNEKTEYVVSEEAKGFFKR